MFRLLIRLLPPLALLGGLAFSAPAAAELPQDKLGQVFTLPVPYPDDWVIVHDVAFDHMSMGRFMVMDTNGKKVTEFYKGSFDGAFIAAFARATTRPEMYVIEHYYDRGNRGNRVNVVTIYDMATLSPVDEIILTGPKRAEMLVSKYVVSLIDNERFLLIYDFTPGTFITVVDLEQRKVVNDVQLPTCAGVYPTGSRGFSSLCNNGSMISFQLDENGAVTTQSKLPPFFDIDQDALFERPAIIDGVGYFPSFSGEVQEIDLRGDAAQLGEKWSLLNADDKAGNWRPGGAWLTATDSTRRLYALMHENGGEGSHDDPGSEIWVFDVQQRERVKRLPLVAPAFAFDITAGAAPRIVATNIEMSLDIYDAVSGAHINTIDGGSFYHNWPLLVYASP